MSMDGEGGTEKRLDRFDSDMFRNGFSFLKAAIDAFFLKENVL